MLAYRASVESRVLHATNILFIFVGLAGGLLLWVLTFGLASLTLFFLLSTVPLGVFVFMLYRGKRNRVLWTIESGLLTLGLVGFFLGLVSSRPSPASSADDTGLLFIACYFAFLLLATAMIALSSALLKSQLVLHNLEQLAVAVATGLIPNPEAISRRFERVMRSWWLAEWRQVASSGKLLELKTSRALAEYRDEVIYQWVIETYGEVRFVEWLNRNQDRLQKLFGGGMKRKVSSDLDIGSKNQQVDPERTSRH